MKVDNIAHDVEMLKIRTSPLEERKTTPMNAIQFELMKTLGCWLNLKIDGLEKNKRKIELRAFLPTPLLLLSKLWRILKLLARITSLVHLMDRSMVMLTAQP